jgi:two-component system, chemotaxis family, protein-glutamate methylesterase/glutaminase
MARPGKRGHDLIAIGGSAGSLDTMLAIARRLPADFSGTLFFLAHVGHSRSTLPQLLANAGRLPAAAARDGEQVRPGHIHVAAPDCHMLVEDGRLRLTRGPREHFTRPAIDPLFRSLARAQGPRAIGVLLSGTGSDGAAGLEDIRRGGGRSVVEDPATALSPEMPQAALAIGPPDFVAAAADIPELLLRLAAEPASAEPATPAQTLTPPFMKELERPLTFTCPDCGGALRAIPGTRQQQYACHIGHRFGAPELLGAQSTGVEQGINIALRLLNEQAEFARRMIENARTAPLDNALVYWERMQAQAEEQAESLRRFLERRPTPEFVPEA